MENDFKIQSFLFIYLKVYFWHENKFFELIEFIRTMGYQLV